MNYEQEIDWINEALRDIHAAEGTVGDARTEETALLYASIAQAKLLAIIARTLLELKENYVGYCQYQAGRE